MHFLVCILYIVIYYFIIYRLSKSILIISVKYHLYICIYVCFIALFLVYCSSRCEYPQGLKILRVSQFSLSSDASCILGIEDITELMQQSGEGGRLQKEIAVSPARMEMASTVDEFELYVCLETRRSQNIGTLVRCAAAFGATALIIVGSDRVGSHGAHGAQNHIRIFHFFYWSECLEFVRSRGCRVCAVISDFETRKCRKRCFTINDMKFEVSTALIVTRNHESLTSEQEAMCDLFLTIHLSNREFAEMLK